MFHFFSRAARPLSNHLNVVIRYIRIRFHGQGLEGKRSPYEQHNTREQNHEAVPQGKIHGGLNHCCSFWVSRSNASAELTTWSPA